MLIGGVACRSAFAQTIHDYICKVRSAGPFRESIQWKNFNARKLALYHEVIDQFLYWNSEHLVDFHALVIDRRKLNNREYHGGDNELAFDKFMYTSLMALYGRYPDALRFRCVHGIRTSPYPLEAIRKKLNNTIAKPGNVFLQPYRELKYGVVQQSGPLQLADLLLGIVGTAWNADRRGTGDSRKELVEHFRRECCVTRLNGKSPMACRHFDIWELKMKGGQ